jgi:putative flippase GtrA
VGHAAAQYDDGCRSSDGRLGYADRGVPILLSRIRAERDRLARFLVTGVAGAVLNVVLFDAFSRGLGVDYRVAVVLAFALSYVFSFVVNRTWTFEATDGHAGHQGARFVVISAASTTWALMLTVVAVETLGVPKRPAEAASALLTAPVAFVLHRRFTFVTPAVPEELAAPAPTS